MKPKEHEARLRADIDRDRRWRDYEATHHADFDQHLAEREANVKALALDLAKSDDAAAQHAVNVNLADRLIRTKVSTSEVSTPAEVKAALAHFGATDDVLRLAASCLERADAESALVHLHRQVTGSTEEAAVAAAREAVIRRLVREHRMKEHLANRELENRLEN
jgi:hypothetical protein